MRHPATCTWSGGGGPTKTRPPQQEGDPRHVGLKSPRQTRQVQAQRTLTQGQAVAPLYHHAEFPLYEEEPAERAGRNMRDPREAPRSSRRQLEVKVRL